MFSVIEKNIFRNYLILVKSHSCVRNQNHSGEFQTKREIFCKENSCQIRDKIERIYKSGEGLKSLAKELDVTYSIMRGAFKYLSIDIRRGYNVITDKLREKRRIWALENSCWKDWPRKKPDMHKKCARSIQGWYPHKDNFIYIRSTYEFIYAEWLNKNNVNWKYEQKYFQLTKDIRYLPDFFIYDSNDELIEIVEVKSTYYSDNRIYKPKLLQEQINIPVTLITDENILNYTNITYGEEKNRWKTIRQKSAELRKLQS